MATTIYDLRSFYECRKGHIVQPLLQNKILSIWPDAPGLRMLGCGYAVPFLDPYLASAERVIAVMPPRSGVHAWTPDGRNHAVLAAETELPIETESVDRILLMHGLEHSHAMGPYLQELWRVLKSTGRILIVTPNRLGLWARAEWSPFGHGTPFSGSQLSHALRENLFVIERTERALYVPPFRSSFLLRSSLPLEKIGPKFMRGMAGVLLVEASKQLYGGVLAQGNARITNGRRRVLVASTAPGTGKTF
ncbi:MAG: SAM-dependent methyltransferase 2, in cluster with Hydroxyacylglutathione hydrolase [Micavibrio sp.]|nr:SAM-dependent methyltransferase 2, in cluster with Hydroxyacylglutathione hydrolase [Micavibrio sp.]